RAQPVHLRAGWQPEDGFADRLERQAIEFVHPPDLALFSPARQVSSDDSLELGQVRGNRLGRECREHETLSLRVVFAVQHGQALAAEEFLDVRVHRLAALHRAWIDEFSARVGTDDHRGLPAEQPGAEHWPVANSTVLDETKCVFSTGKRLAGHRNAGLPGWKLFGGMDIRWRACTTN